MRQLHQKWQDQESEELLFQLIFKSLGYSVNAAAFEELARLYPYSNLRKLLRTTPRESKTKVLSRWFGAAGILSSKSLPRNPELRRDLLQCCLLYTSDAADDSLRVDLGGRRII